MRIVDTKKSLVLEGRTTGRTFEPISDLEVYLKWVVENVSISPWSLIEKNLSFADGVVGLVVHRDGQFQTQLFTVEPNVSIPNHRHPNVDSYEVAMNGMTFTHSGRTIPFKIMRPGMAIYVDHDDLHEAYTLESGGCFLSVQQWLNGVSPTSVGNDWTGDTMGPQHDSNIDSK
tara:strand:+ start:1762 stop:2280 length:519 start_codon:yes stop_codon:yes gene_type:complete